MRTPTVVIEPRKGLFDLDLGALWKYRELVYFLVWRDVKIRYKQTLIGGAWAIVQPLVAMFIFAIIFGRLAGIPSDGLPYPIFAYTALLPWTFFAEALGRSGKSLVGDGHLITKVYFPRLIIPLASVTTPLVDFFLSFMVLLALMSWYGITVTPRVLALPLLMLLALMTSLSVTLWLSPLNVRYRDVAHTLPFLTQIWMYASPVVYPVSLIPERYRLLYSLNPMVGVIEGFRWALLGTQSPDFGVMAVSAVVVLALLFAGTVYFKQMERTLADVV